MTVSDFIGKKVIIHLPKVPELHWYSYTPTGKYLPQDSPYNNKIGSVTVQYTDEKITEDDEMVIVQFENAHILPNGNEVSWLPVSIYDLEIVNEHLVALSMAIDSLKEEENNDLRRN